MKRLFFVVALLTSLPSFGDGTAPGRYQLVVATVIVDGKSEPRVFRIDTATGETTYFRSASMSFPTKDGTAVTHLIEGWSPVPEFGSAMLRAERTSREFHTAPVVRKPAP